MEQSPNREATACSARQEILRIFIEH